MKNRIISVFLTIVILLTSVSFAEAKYPKNKYTPVNIEGIDEPIFMFIGDDGSTQFRVYRDNNDGMKKGFYEATLTVSPEYANAMSNGEQYQVPEGMSDTYVPLDLTLVGDKPVKNEKFGTGVVAKEDVLVPPTWNETKKSGILEFENIFNKKEQYAYVTYDYGMTFVFVPSKNNKPIAGAIPVVVSELATRENPYGLENYKMPNDLKNGIATQVQFKTSDGYIVTGRTDYPEIVKENLVKVQQKKQKPIKTMEYREKKSKYDLYTHRLQKKLKTLGYIITDKDGIYGESTKQAVEQYQTNNNISITGSVDKDLYDIIITTPTYNGNNNSANNNTNNNTTIPVVPENNNNSGNNTGNNNSNTGNNNNNTNRLYLDDYVQALLYTEKTSYVEGDTMVVHGLLQHILGLPNTVIGSLSVTGNGINKKVNSLPSTITIKDIQAGTYNISLNAKEKGVQGHELNQSFNITVGTRGSKEEQGIRITKNVTEVKAIRAETQYVPDNTLPEGVKGEKVSIGSDGKETYVYEIVYLNGKIVEKNEISHTINKQAVPDVYKIGTLKLFNGYSISPQNPKHGDNITVNIDINNPNNEYKLAYSLVWEYNTTVARGDNESQSTSFTVNKASAGNYRLWIDIAKKNSNARSFNVMKTFTVASPPANAGDEYRVVSLPGSGRFEGEWSGKLAGEAQALCMRMAKQDQIFHEVIGNANGESVGYFACDANGNTGRNVIQELIDHQPMVAKEKYYGYAGVIKKRVDNYGTVYYALYACIKSNGAEKASDAGETPTNTDLTYTVNKYDFKVGETINVEAQLGTVSNAKYEISIYSPYHYMPAKLVKTNKLSFTFQKEGQYRVEIQAGSKSSTFTVNVSKDEVPPTEVIPEETETPTDDMATPKPEQPSDPVDNGNEQDQPQQPEEPKNTPEPQPTEPPKPTAEPTVDPTEKPQEELYVVEIIVDEYGRTIKIWSDGTAEYIDD